MEEEKAPSVTQLQEQRTTYHYFFIWMVIGALVSGNVLGPILTIYIKELMTTTSTTTTSTSTSSTTSTSTTSTTSTSTTSTTTTMYPLVPSGVIWLWSGSIATVPQGWAICDGTQGTPDLRNRFIIGSGSGALYSPSQVGGSSSVTASITVGDTVLSVAQMPSHSHGGNTGIENVAQIYYDLQSVSYGELSPTVGNRWINTRGYDSCSNCQHSHPISAEGGGQPHTHTATMAPINTTPPFYALLYIMKL